MNAMTEAANTTHSAQLSLNNADLESAPLNVLVAGAQGSGKTTLIAALKAAAGSGADATNLTKFTSGRTVCFHEATEANDDLRHLANMAISAHAAIVVVDVRDRSFLRARQAILAAGLLGVRHIIVAVNKLDLVANAWKVFGAIVHELSEPFGSTGLPAPTFIPLSAATGQNVITRPKDMSWHTGTDLLGHILTLPIAQGARTEPFRLAPRGGSAPHGSSRNIEVHVVSGRISAGDEIIAPASGRRTRLLAIASGKVTRDEAVAGDDVTLTLADEIKTEPCEILTPPSERPEVSDQFAAHLFWFDPEHLLPGRTYDLRINGGDVQASVTGIKYRIDPQSPEHIAARNLERNEIGVVTLAAAQPVCFDPFAQNRKTGAFVLHSRATDEMVALGTISFGLRRATNIHVEELFVDKNARARAKGQRPTVIWFTGLSGSGKSTIAKRLEERLHALGRHTYVLDGDNVRHGLNRDLGFTDTDRVENIRRIGEVAKLFADAGLIVICSFISPFRAERRMVRELMGDGEFIEVFIDASIAECQRRDPKGLYAKALAGKVKNFTGIDSPYEPPEEAELQLATEDSPPDVLVDRLIGYLAQKGRA